MVKVQIIYNSQDLTIAKADFDPDWNLIPDNYLIRKDATVIDVSAGVELMISVSGTKSISLVDKNYSQMRL